MQIGDIVKAVSGIEGIFQGQDTSEYDYWAIQRLDGTRGGAQNGWWSCSKNSTLEKLDKALLIHCPTQEEYNMVVKKLLDGGREWLDNSKEIHSKDWEEYKEKTVIAINWYGNGTITYGDVNNKECRRPIVETTAKEFLGEYSTAIYKEDNKPKKNIMSKIKSFVKNLTLSADDKLLREYGFQNECGDYTEIAEELVISKLVADNKDYVIEIAKKMKEEDDKE